MKTEHDFECDVIVIGAKLINSLGMESPGLTSCLSIADFVAKLQH
jgi:hypothetical protein